MTRTDQETTGSGPSGSVAGTYDRLARRWDTDIAPLASYPVAAWIRRADRFLHYGDPVVDLGCGTATPAAWILAGRYHYIGVDLSAEMTSRAAVNAPGCPFHTMDMARVSFGDRSIGAVLCFDAIDHVPRDQHPDLFRSIHRWLRTSGVLIANFRTLDVADVWEPSWLDAGPMYWSSHTVEQTVDQLEEAGFNVVDEARLSHHDYDGVGRERLWVVAQRTELSVRARTVPSTRRDAEDLID